MVLDFIVPATWSVLRRGILLLLLFELDESPEMIPVLYYLLFLSDYHGRWCGGRWWWRRRRRRRLSGPVPAPGPSAAGRAAPRRCATAGTGRSLYFSTKNTGSTLNSVQIVKYTEKSADVIARLRFESSGKSGCCLSLSLRPRALLFHSTFT